MGLLERIEGHMNLLGEMIQRTDADLTRLDGHVDEAALRNAIGRCVMCTHARECRAWLAAAEPGSAPPGFCANAALLSSLAQGRRRGDPLL